MRSTRLSPAQSCRAAIGAAARPFAVLLAFSMMASPALLAQGGGAGGAGGAGAAGSGASGPGAAAAGHGAGQAAGASGANAAAANGAQNGQSPASIYASSTSMGPDPRKPPTSRPDALTLRQVIDGAEARNPTLLAARQNLSSVRAQELQAAVRANPYFTLYGTNVDQSSRALQPAQYSAQLSRLFERGEKRRWRLDVATNTTAQTQSQLEDTIRTTVFAIKQAFVQMLIAKEALELANASLKDFEHEVEIANDRYRAGDLGKLDFERLDLQLGGFESDRANALIVLQQSSLQLQTFMGQSPSPTFDIKGDIVPPLVSQTEEQLTQEALIARPDYAAARAGVAVADANVHLARANGTTDPTLEAEYDYSPTSENSVGFSIDIPLRIFDRNQGNKETTRFQADASRFTVAAARNQVVADVAQAWVGYTQAKRLSDRFTDHYLEESRDVLTIAQFAFEHGGIALIDYLDALRDARTTTSDALNAYQTTWLAIHQLSQSAAIEVTP